MNLIEELTEASSRVGAILLRVTTPEPFTRYLDELEARRSMYEPRYSRRIPGFIKMARPAEVLPGARAVVVIGYPYLLDEKPLPNDAPRGKIARIVSHGHMGAIRGARAVVRALRSRGFKAIPGIHRKEAAVRSGMGVIGKNGLVLTRDYGSWVALQAVVTDAPLSPDSPDGEYPECRDCTLCLDACPTGALYEPGRLDPRHCITYNLTLRDMPEEFWDKTRGYILGCEDCLLVCPHNNKATRRQGLDSLLPEVLGNRPLLSDILLLTERSFQRKVMHFTMNKLEIPRLARFFSRHPWFARLVKPSGSELVPETFIHASGSLSIYKRNAILALGQMKCSEAKPLLEGLRSDPYLRPYVLWALSRME
ncbi:MAG: 4Fe-4S double cluster binding domain-containing protein [candidate division WOR-3 bacterium]